MTSVPILLWHLPYGHQKTPNFRVCSDVAGDAWRETHTCGWKCYSCLRRWVWYRKTLHPVHHRKMNGRNLQNHPFSFGKWSEPTKPPWNSCSSRSSSGVKQQPLINSPSSSNPKKVTFGGVIEALASKLGLPSAHLSEVGRNGRCLGVEKGTTVGEGRTQAQG